MPIRINQPGAKDLTKKVIVEYDGDSAVIEFFYRRITPTMIEQFTRAGERSVNALCETLEDLVASWDVVGQPSLSRDEFEQQLAAMLRGDEDEGPSQPARLVPAVQSRATQQANGIYPTEAFALMQLPMDFLNTVAEGIFGAAVPNSKKTGKR